MAILCPKKSVALVILIVLFVAVTPSPVWADQADAANAISSAKNAILNGYSETKQAEAAGANITALVGTLKEAGSLLSQAELAYATNDFDVALNFAIQSQTTLNNFVSEATTLREIRTLQRNIDFIINVIFPIVGIYAVVVAGFVAWHFFRKKYETAGGHKNESSRV